MARQLDRRQRAHIPTASLRRAHNRRTRSFSTHARIGASMISHTRICSKCGVEESQQHPFIKQSKICKTCYAEYQRQWRAANPEKHRAANQRWRERHPEKSKAASQQWREKHPESAKYHQTSWQKQHPKEHSRRQVIWKQKQREKKGKPA